MDQYHLPDDVLVQIQEPVEFVTEARFWIAHGKITAESIYRHYDWIWGAEDGPADHVASATMYRMRLMLRRLLDKVSTAPGCTIDMGVLGDGSVSVVEANAAWSSGPYDGDPQGIYQAIVASHDFANKYPQWAWRHNPIFNKVAPLKLSKSVT